MDRPASKLAPEHEATGEQGSGQEQAAEAPGTQDPVDTWGIDSFPASDPPQRWAGPPD